MVVSNSSGMQLLHMEKSKNPTVFPSCKRGYTWHRQPTIWFLNRFLYFRFDYKFVWYSVSRGDHKRYLKLCFTIGYPKFVALKIIIDVQVIIILRSRKARFMHTNYPTITFISKVMEESFRFCLVAFPTRYIPCQFNVCKHCSVTAMDAISI